MLLSAVSVLVVAQSSSEISEGLMNNSVYIAYLVCIVIIEHHPGKFLAALSRWLSQFRSCTPTYSCTGMTVSLLWCRNYCGCRCRNKFWNELYQKRQSKTATRDEINSSNTCCHLSFCGDRHGDVAPCILQEISDVSKNGSRVALLRRRRVNVRSTLGTKEVKWLLSCTKGGRNTFLRNDPKRLLYYMVLYFRQQ
jgi:hypothetical protein